MSYSPKFWDKMAEKYAEQPVDDEAAYQKKLDITRSHFTSGMNVLEFGCGTGSTAIVHAPYVKSILAVDFSGKMIEIARGKAAEAGVENVQFEVGAIEDLKAENARFDVILGMSILHLLEDKQAVMARVFELLKPGGFFISSTACVGDMRATIRFILPIIKMFGLAPPLDMFTAKALVASILDAGFTIEHEWRPRPNEAVFIVAKKP